MTPALVLHGGAGAWPDGLAVQADAAIQHCADTGWARMEDGALEAVIAAVRALEDDPLFNAGIGACLTSAGTIQHDAGVMEGTTLRAGAVGAVLGPRHPVDLARAVMDRTEHVLLVGQDAVDFGANVGVEMADPAMFITERRRAGLITSDTVGAVAIDAGGRTAVAVSTGGYTGKIPGRLGDSPIAGAGFYADDDAGAVAATGKGEGFMRLVLARQVRDMLADGAAPLAAADTALGMLDHRFAMTGGLIVVDCHGDIGWCHTTPHMPVAVRGGRAVNGAPPG